jgi:hypothetical protein
MYCLSQGLALTPLAATYLGTSGTGSGNLLSTTGLLAASIGVGLQLYVAATNYAKVSPTGYNAVADVSVRRWE